MCMICNDWDKSDKARNDILQGIQNLFETKEKLGVEHTKEVVSLLTIYLSYERDNRDGRMIRAIKKFITPEPPPPPLVIDRSKL